MSFPPTMPAGLRGKDPVASPMRVHTSQESEMSPEEIIEYVDAQNRNLLYSRDDFQNLTHEQVLQLMNIAAMRGFRFGSECALSLVKSKLLVRYLSETASDLAE